MTGQTQVRSPSGTQNVTPVLVLGVGLTVLGVIRSLGRKGIPAYCLSEDLSFEAHSRWCHPAPVRLGAFASASDLAAALEASPIERAVVMACSDHWTLELARLDPSLQDRFSVCLPEREALKRFIDKRLFAELLAEVGVPRPTTRIATQASDLDGVDIGPDYPWFFKPTDSQRFASHFHKKALRLSSRDEAVALLDEIQEAGLEVILQEYIPGPADCHYFVDGFVDRSHRLQTCFARRRIRMNPPDFGNSSYVISVDTEAVGEAIATIEALFEATKYRGIFSAEFKLDSRDNHFKIVEVNCRPWWYVEFATVCGVDVVEMAYLDALGRPVTPVDRYKVGAGLVFPQHDYRAFRELQRSGQLSFGTWLRSWASARRAVFCWDDPMPALAQMGKRFTTRLKHG